MLADNPLVANKKKLVPSVTGVFKTTQNMYVYVETYELLATTYGADHGVRELLSRKIQIV